MKNPSKVSTFVPGGSQEKGGHFDLLFLFYNKQPLSLHLPNKNMITQEYQTNISFLILCCISFVACSPKLQTVLLEDENGNTELIYAGNPSTENLVKEIKYFANGDTLSITPMLKGAVDGEVKKFNSDNQPSEIFTFKKGVQNGTYKRFDKEGFLIFEGELENGLKTGVWTTWYDDVQVQEQRSYSNDVANGKWTYYYIDGSVKREEVYKNGKLIEEKNF